MILGYPEIGGGSNLIITEGVISGFYTKDKYILTSAQISGGNSGGLALSNGCYIGIPAYQYTEEDGSLGEIISIDLIQEFVDSLKKPFDAEKLKAEQ
jgi:S1-C subfamily serine protease